MPNHMKTYQFLTYAVVLWTLVESRHAGRLRRSLDVEERSSNLTQKHEQEVIQADFLQHFTTPTSPTPSSPPSTEPLSRDLPGIPEDINIQSLKNDDHLRATYDRKITIDKDTPNDESSDERNKTLKHKTNDIIVLKINQTDSLSSKTSDVTGPHLKYEQLSTSVAFDKEEVNHKNQEQLTKEYHPVVSSTESVKIDPEWKSYDLKKKEKGKKEILESVTVPTDYNVAGKIEKPVKDNVISNKVKDKNIKKDSIPEALDEKRSTIRISNISSSVSISERDNNRLGSLDILVGATGTNEESVNQSVNSVINNNGVNSESLKKPRVKYSIKRVSDVVNETEADNTSASDNLLNEEAVKNLLPQTTPSVQTSSIRVERLPDAKQYPPLQQSKPTESSPTKIDIFGKASTPQPTAIIKPSIAFKQQLANKLKNLEPSPTVPINAGEDGLDESLDKASSKLPIKSSLRKKPKPDYAAAADANIPPTATAWTLVSMKSTSEGLRSTSHPSPSNDSQTLTPEHSWKTRHTTITPVTRIKSFVPWSTRLQKITSVRPPTTPLDDHEQMEILNSTDTSTTQEPSVIRTTLELERNFTETSINLIQPSSHDFMIKDESSTAGRAQEISEVIVASTKKPTTSSIIEEEKSDNSEQSDLDKKLSEKENIIETKLVSEENDEQVETDEKSQNILEENKDESKSNNSVIELLPQDVSEQVNEIKSIHINDSVNLILTTTIMPTPQTFPSSKIKNISEVSDLDQGTSDILVDGVDDGKSAEDSEEDEIPKTTKLPPLFDLFETTASLDLDEDVDENERDSEELSIIIDKVPPNITTTTETIINKYNNTFINTKPTTSTAVDMNTNISYVTSFDIISTENMTQIATKTPSEGDFNWYSVDTKAVNVSVEDANQKSLPVEITTTAAIETTNEPVTTTESSNQDTTSLPETTESVASPVPVSSSTMPPTTPEPSVVVEDGSDLEVVENPTSCVRVVVHVSPWKLCHGQQQLRESIASQLITDVTWEQIVILDRRLQDCETKEQSTQIRLLDVDVCFIDKQQEPSPVLRDEFLKLYTKRANDPTFPIVKVQMIMQPSPMPSGFDNVLAAIVLSVIAAICLVLLGILLVIVRKRQGRFNYGQRCTPVSLDDYSLDNISMYNNSVRRKGALRASKRSYGNPAFDDPSGPSHPINFAGLANFSNDRAGLDEEFNQIPMITVKPDELPPGAEIKNRYANVIPLPETRVPLQTKEGANPLDDYVNANYIKGPKGQDKLYIACQAPLQSTVEDFWRMVWQQQTKVILMLTALNENGVEKCADYLPQLEITDCCRLFGDFQVTLKKHEVREKYIISSLQLKNLETNMWREVTHLWYSSWPAQGVPEDGSAMIAFLIEARSYTRGAQGPTVVHCSPGTGRTGTVIAIDLCIRDFETLRSVDIPRTVYALRRDRAGAVQTKDQYAFIYQVLNLYATKLTGGALDSI